MVTIFINALLSELYMLRVVFAVYYKRKQCTGYVRIDYHLKQINCMGTRYGMNNIEEKCNSRPER
jgi:hypothetical protein